MRILITGGTGLIGRALIPQLNKDEHHIVLFSRDKDRAKYSFSAPRPRFENIIDNLDDIDFNTLDAVVNLAGEAIINKRWSDKQKRILCDSRWQLTTKLANKILASESPPSTFISGSAIGIYGRQGESHVDEDFDRFHPEFSSKLCKEWEALALKAESEKTRVCLLRTGIVLAENGGALSKMLPAFRLGLGGPIGNGQQAMSWIHIEDMANMIIFILNKPELSGPFNATAPESVTNKVFSNTLAKQLHRPCFFIVPAFLLKLVMGEMSDLI